MFIHNMSNIRNMFENSNLSRNKRKEKGRDLLWEKSTSNITDGMYNNNNNSIMESINMKLKSGKKLSASEIEYLKQNAPELYKEIIKLEQERKMFENRLKSCKTKSEALSVYSMKMCNISESSKDDSKTEMRMKAMEDEWKTYVSKGKYKQLPFEEKNKLETDNEKKDNEFNEII